MRRAVRLLSRIRQSTIGKHCQSGLTDWLHELMSSSVQKNMLILIGGTFWAKCGKMRHNRSESSIIDENERVLDVHHNHGVSSRR